MRKMVLPMGLAALALAGCEDYAATGEDGHLRNLPEALIEIAAPHQDLSTVMIDPVDGCYVYRHVGPVETTYIPLRTRDGKAICTRARG